MDPAPLARAQDTEDQQGEAEGRQGGADEIEAWTRLRRGVRDPTSHEENHQHEHDLSGEDPAPGEVRRGEAPDQRTDGDGDRPGGGNEAVGRGAALGREVPGDERHDRGQDERGTAPSRNDQPKSSTGRFGAMAVMNDPHP